MVDTFKIIPNIFYNLAKPCHAGWNVALGTELWLPSRLKSHQGCPPCGGNGPFWWGTTACSWLSLHHTILTVASFHVLKKTPQGLQRQGQVQCTQYWQMNDPPTMQSPLWVTQQFLLRLSSFFFQVFFVNRLDQIILYWYFQQILILNESQANPDSQDKNHKINHF